MIFVKIFYSILLITFGYLIIKYRKIVHSWTGNFVWAEKYLGTWGTYFVLIVFALFLVFIGVLYPFWGFELLLSK